MQMEAGLDTGPVRPAEPVRSDREIPPVIFMTGWQRSMPIFWPRSRRIFPPFLTGPNRRTMPQQTYAAKITPAEAEIDWTHPAEVIDRQICAFTPVPGAWFTGPKGRIRVRAAHLGQGPTTTAAPGTFLGIDEGGMRVATGDSEIILVSLAAGRRTGHAGA